MQFKVPKNDNKYHWTQHVVRKMMHYGLSPDRVKRVIRAPQRMEVGIAEGTLAAMQKTGTPKKPTEVWVMWAEKAKKKSEQNPLGNHLKVIITAWRYPGISPVRDEIPIPASIVAELQKEGILW